MSTLHRADDQAECRPAFPTRLRSVVREVWEAAQEPSPLKGTVWTWWYWGRDPISRLHRMARRFASREEPACRESRAWRLLMICLWPAAIARMAVPLARGEMGRMARERGAGPWWRQVGQQWWLAVRYNKSPKAYYGLALYLPERRRQVRQYMQSHELCKLLPNVATEGREMLVNKYRFWRFCEDNALPSIPVIARVAPSFILEEGDHLPARDLFVKPEGWSCGRGIGCWRYQQETATWSDGEASLDEDELKSRLEELAQERPLIVQPRVGPDEEVARWASGALCTVRVVTFCLNATVEVIVASLRMPSAGSMTDNLQCGGLAAGVGADGALSRAIQLSSRQADTHPDTGSRIEGEKLPYWQEVQELAKRAHLASKYAGFVGWDVGFTGAGLVLVEANVNFGPAIMQMPTGQPICQMGFVERFDRLLEHLEAAEAASGREQDRAPDVAPVAADH